MPKYYVCQNCGYPFQARKYRRTRNPRECPKCRSTSLESTIYLNEFLEAFLRNYEEGLVDRRGRPVRKAPGGAPRSPGPAKRPPPPRKASITPSEALETSIKPPRAALSSGSSASGPDVTKGRRDLANKRNVVKLKIPEVIIQEWGQYRALESGNLRSDMAWVLGRYGGKYSKKNYGIHINQEIAKKIVEALYNGDRAIEK